MRLFLITPFRAASYFAIISTIDQQQRSIYSFDPTGSVAGGFNYDFSNIQVYGIKQAKIIQAGPRHGQAEELSKSRRKVLLTCRTSESSLLETTHDKYEYFNADLAGLREGNAPSCESQTCRSDHLRVFFSSLYFFSTVNEHYSRGNMFFLLLFSVTKIVWLARLLKKPRQESYFPWNLLH